MILTSILLVKIQLTQRQLVISIPIWLRLTSLSYQGKGLAISIFKQTVMMLFAGQAFQNLPIQTQAY
ncbi:hypothetical protein RC95_12780 [Pectobacterium brasiliense]|nr:hypothetical protein RC95_12780 [Pectobacterium brasiliense]